MIVLQNHKSSHHLATKFSRDDYTKPIQGQGNISTHVLITVPDQFEKFFHNICPKLREDPWITQCINCHNSNSPLVLVVTWIIGQLQQPGYDGAPLLIWNLIPHSHFTKAMCGYAARIHILIPGKLQKAGRKVLPQFQAHVLEAICYIHQTPPSPSSGSHHPWNPL